MNEIIKDGGFKSRKLWFSVFAVVALFLGAGLAAWLPSVAPLYGELVGGIVAIAGLFLTGSVATKWVGSKLAQALPPKPPDAP
jgi:hypothetical protein